MMADSFQKLFATVHVSVDILCHCLNELERDFLPCKENFFFLVLVNFCINVYSKKYNNKMKQKAIYLRQDINGKMNLRKILVEIF